MHSLEQIREIIDIRIKSIAIPHDPAELYEPIAYSLSIGGKRLRPALCLLACGMFNRQIDKAIDPAVGIEIFHNFTLVHDDIMDKAPIRRGNPTVFKKWNPNIAILSGDTMMAMAYEFIMKAPEELRNKVFTAFNKTVIEVCEGQQHDMNFETRPDVTIADYIEMIRLKTAVLLAASLKIGALIGGAMDHHADKLYSFGENIGIAFQLKDDLLDAFSDDAGFGKIKGGDIAANKKTYLFLKAFDLAKGETLNKLRHAFSYGVIDQSKKIKEVLEIYEELNIREITETEILSFYQKAIRYLDEIDIEPERKVILKRIADNLNSRNF